MSITYSPVVSACLLFSICCFAAPGPEAAIPALQYFPKVRDLTLSVEHGEAYTTIQSPLEDRSTIVRLKVKQGQFSVSRIARFSGRFKDLEPFLAPDGLKLYFASNRPLGPHAVEAKDFDIWVVSRQSPDHPWSEATRLPEPVNSEHDEFFPSVAANGNLYFTSDTRGSMDHDDILICNWQNGVYGAAHSLGAAINSDGYEFNATIAPDESLLVFGAYNRPAGEGSGDLYYSLRQEDGSWSPAVSFGAEVNSPRMDYCPCIDFRNKLLYFTSRRSSSVAAGRIESLVELEQEVKRYANGQSRIYRVSIDRILSPK